MQRNTQRRTRFACALPSGWCARSLRHLHLCIRCSAWPLRFLRSLREKNIYVSTYHGYLRVFFYQQILQITLSFPRDTCDTWRQVNAPHGKQFNPCNLLINKYV